MLLFLHEIREGVVLDLAFEINEVSGSHNTLKKWNRKPIRHHPRRVQTDSHNKQEVCGNNSQQDREKGAWESTSDEDEPQSGMSMLKVAKIALLNFVSRTLK